LSRSVKGDKVLITVADTGVGISEEVKPKLFTPLFTTKSKGQGFGLAVIKKLTEALGGTITFESAKGKGTKFTVKFPISHYKLLGLEANNSSLAKAFIDI
jgi:signal transduction histidine kinase